MTKSASEKALTLVSELEGEIECIVTALEDAHSQIETLQEQVAELEEEKREMLDELNVFNRRFR